MRALMLALAACGGGEPRRVQTWVGPAEDGFGASLGYEGSELLIGAPFGAVSAVYRHETLSLTGEGRDFLGAWISANPVWIGAPLRAPGGVVLDPTGAVVLRGEPGDNLGAAPTRIAREPAGLRVRGLTIGARRVDLDGRAWSLVSFDVGGGSRWVAGLARGGLVLEGGEVRGEGAYGRGLAACDLDGRPGDEVIVGDPLSGLVEILAGSDVERGRRDSPLASFQLGAGAGAPIVCADGRLWIGAPDQDRVFYLDRPLRSRSARSLEGSGGRLGEALAVRGDQIAVGDPASGEVHIWAR